MIAMIALQVLTGAVSVILGIDCYVAARRIVSLEKRVSALESEKENGNG